MHNNQAQNMDGQRRVQRELLGKYKPFLWNFGEYFKLVESGRKPTIDQGIIRGFNKEFQTWRENIQIWISERLENVDLDYVRTNPIAEEHLKYLDDINNKLINEGVLGEFQITDLTTLIDGLLRMNELGRPNKNLQTASDIRKIDSIHFWLDYANKNYNIAKGIPFIKAERLLGAKYLQMDIESERNILSMVTLFTNISTSNGNDVYSKSLYFDILEGSVPIQRNDLSVSKPEIPGLFSSTSQSYYDRLHNPDSFIKDYETLIKRRAEMLRESPIYIKCPHGSQGFGITRLTYNGERLLINSTLDDKIQIYSSKDLRKICFDKDFSGLEKAEGVRDDGTPYIIYSGNLPDCGAVTAEIQENEAVEVTLWDLHPYTGVNHSPLFFLSKFNLKKLEDNLYEAYVSDSELEDFLYGLEGLYNMERLSTYAEEAIQTPKINGKTWEIRVINIAKGFDNAKPYTMYVKMGESDFIANISRGGIGADYRETVKYAYSQLRPELSDEQIDSLVEKYLRDVAEAAIKTVEKISNYYTQIKDQSAPRFPLKIVPVDSIAPDFMAEIVETEHGKTLRPKLVDINLYYGFSGLQNIDPAKAKELSSILVTKKQEVFQFIEDCHKLYSQL